MKRRNFLKGLLATAAIPLTAKVIVEDEVEWITHHKDGSTTSEWLDDKSFSNKIEAINRYQSDYAIGDSVYGSDGHLYVATHIQKS